MKQKLSAADRSYNCNSMLISKYCLCSAESKVGIQYLPVDENIWKKTITKIEKQIQMDILVFKSRYLQQTQLVNKNQQLKCKR